MHVLCYYEICNIYGHRINKDLFYEWGADWNEEKGIRCLHKVAAGGDSYAYSTLGLICAIENAAISA